MNSDRQKSDAGPPPRAAAHAQTVPLRDQATAVARAREAVKNVKQNKAVQPVVRRPGMPVSTFYFWAYDRE